MDDFLIPPRVFAHHVILQMIQHMLGDDLLVTFDDYMALRTVFRKCGGSWALLGSGDIVQLQLLSTLVSAWGNMPEREREEDRLI